MFDWLRVYLVQSQEYVLRVVAKILQTRVSRKVCKLRKRRFRKRNARNLKQRLCRTLFLVLSRFSKESHVSKQFLDRVCQGPISLQSCGAVFWPTGWRAEVKHFCPNVTKWQRKTVWQTATKRWRGPVKVFSTLWQCERFGSRLICIWPAESLGSKKSWIKHKTSSPLLSTQLSTARPRCEPKLRSCVLNSCDHLTNFFPNWNLTIRHSKMHSTVAQEHGQTLTKTHTLHTNFPFYTL
jgi:hypothetical protein